MLPVLAYWVIVWTFALAAASSLPASWQQWQHLSGVFDIAGPRTDGRLVAAAGGKLFLIGADGSIGPFAQGVGGYQVASGPENYIDVSPGQRVSGAGCGFTADEVFAIRPSQPIGITRVDTSGHASNFVNINGVDSLNGIVFDRVGRFDHRLIVTGPHNQRTIVLAVDCKGGQVVITGNAPPAEGGLAVAPSSFGKHGGELIAPDENSGAVWSIAASGRVEQLVQSVIAHGGDIGVESAGFVPAGFVGGGGYAYLADRATSNNPHPGTDNILRVAATALGPAGVGDGDLLIAAEGGAVTIDVACAASCTSRTIVSTETTAHIEGHLLVVANQSHVPASLPPLSDLGSQRAQQLFGVVVGAISLAAIAVLAVLTARRLRRR